MRIREPSVAGMFYPEKRLVLMQEVKQFLQNNQPAIKPKALIVPHAGYQYSGQVAGNVYQYLKPYQNKFKKVLLIGPAHRKAFHGIGVLQDDFYNTPIGALKIEREIIEKLVDKFERVNYQDLAFNGEHCLEVQFPFLQLVLNQVSIIPTLVSHCDTERVSELIKYFWEEEETLIIISSDLSHFLDYESCSKKDFLTSQNIVSMKGENLQHDDACGQLGIAGLLQVVKEKGFNISEVSRCNSGDVTGEMSRVVGYGGYLIYDL